MKNLTYLANIESSNLFFNQKNSYIGSNPRRNSEKSHDISPIPPSDIAIPVAIFREGLSGLEAISKFLTEEKKLRYCDIALLLNRDQRTIWNAHNDAQQKKATPFEGCEESLHIPVAILRDRSMSVLETITSYLKEYHLLRNRDIAMLLGKDARTIWTAYHRSKKKRATITRGVMPHA